MKVTTRFGPRAAILVWSGARPRGIGAPHYARWTGRSAKAWRGFADELKADSGHDLALRQEGGYDFHFGEDTLAQRLSQYEALKAELGGDYPYEVLGHNALKKEEPQEEPARGSARFEILPK